MQAKTTRAFRTISEAGEELGLQPHVLRFWESKFPQIKPMKRGGGRRFYRPEDIEFLRGIKILLHDEKHPIKDVQKLIRVKGAARVLELGRSVERAAKPKAVEDTVLIPERIVKQEEIAPSRTPTPTPTPTPAPQPTHVETAGSRDSILRPIGAVPKAVVVTPPPLAPSAPAEPILDLTDAVDGDALDPDYHSGVFPGDASAPEQQKDVAPKGMSGEDRKDLETALERLLKLRGKWDDFQKEGGA